MPRYSLDNLTLMYISASRMPAHWMEYQIGELLEAVGADMPIISCTRQPLALGKNLLDDAPASWWNIYVQMRRAAELAETKYVCQVEDDALYSREHFTEFRPPDDAVSYNRSRWSLFSWDPQYYCLRQRISNCTLIAPRDYLIEALTERMAKWPDGAPDHLVGEVGREKVERRLGVSVRKCVEWWSTCPVIHLNHPTATEDRQVHQWKSHGQLKAYDIPYWGQSREVAKHYR